MPVTGNDGVTTPTGSSLGNLRWNIATTNIATNTQNSYITALAGTTTGITNAGEGNLAGNINNFTGNLNSGPAGCGAAGSKVSCFTNQAGANYNGSFTGSGEIWGRSMQYALMDTSGLLGDQLSFYSILRNGSGLTNNPKPATVSTFNGYWTFDSANAAVTWNAQVAAVPVPAAVWLLGSGLMGLVGVGRRKLTVA